jgi:hypothetical protein
MMKINYKLSGVSFFIIMMIATTTSGAFNSAYAGGNNHKNNNDKVRLNCNDVGIALATLSLAYAHLDKQGKDSVDESLEEGEISRNVDDIRDILQNVLHTVDDKCKDVNFIGFVDFKAEDFIK